jgi:ATP-dependent DNA ligase
MSRQWLRAYRCSSEARRPRPSAATGLEPKWDGYRFLVELSPKGVRCWTRHGKRHDGKLPYIEEQLADLFPKGTVLDGELVALDRDKHGEVRHDFGRIGAVLGTKHPHRPTPEKPVLHYVVFDVLGLRREGARGQLVTLFVPSEFLGRVDDSPFFPSGRADSNRRPPAPKAVGRVAAIPLI